MRPPKSCEINGTRPSPLLIHKDSRLIRKQPPQLRQPLIIYTHSPKIIHTQPKDFMALVQRLTGFTPPSNAAPLQTIVQLPLSDNDCSSVLTETDDDDNININHDPRQRSRVLLKEVQSNNSYSTFLSSDTPPFSSPGFVNSLSPSFMEFLKALPEF